MTEVTKPPRAPRVKDERAVSAAELSTIERYLERSVPEKHKLSTQRALLGQMGKANALKQKCLQCCNYEVATVKVCAVITCALYPVRPYQDKEDLPSEDD